MISFNIPRMVNKFKKDNELDFVRKYKTCVLFVTKKHKIEIEYKIVLTEKGFYSRALKSIKY